MANLFITEASDYWFRVSIAASTERRTKLTSNDVVLSAEGNDKRELATGNVRRAIRVICTRELRPIERRSYARS